MPLTMQTPAVGNPDSGAVPKQHGLVQFVSNAELDKMDVDAAKAEESQSEPEKLTISTYVDQVWDANKRYKEDSGVEEDMLQSLRQREAKYSGDKLQAIKEQGLSEVFLSLTDVKCRAGESWIHDVMANPSQKCWKLDPTPLPELPQEIEDAIVQRTMEDWMMQAQQTGVPPEPEVVYEFASKLRNQSEQIVYEIAETRAGRMETKIEDQMVEGKWDEAFDDFVTDLVTSKAGILKGPIVRKTRKLKWVKGVQGVRVPHVVESVHYEYERVSPFDMYPSEGAVNIDDGDLCERVKYTRKSLSAMKGVKGWDVDAINLVLQKYGPSGFRIANVSADQERETLERKSVTASTVKTLIEGIEFWGSIQGQLLIDRGMDKTPDGKEILSLEEYEVCAVKLGDVLVYCGFNEDPLQRRPYSKTGYAKIPGSFWYRGIPELMKDLQDICNAAVRSLCNNMAIASGPIMSIEDITRIAPGQDVTNIMPWMILQFIRKPGDNTDAVKFHNVESHAQELVAVYDKFSMLADDYTGIPAYQYGSDKAAGAGRTMGGLEMLMNSSARGIKRVIGRIDIHVLSTIIQRQYDLNMMFDPDESIKGDCQIRPVGTMGLILKEQVAQRRLAFLEQSGANPVDQVIFPPEYRANVWRALAKDLEMPVDDVVPPDEDIKARQEEAKQAAMAQEAAASAPPAPVGV